jgi:DNA-binding PadR family transcriptional regulator
MREHGLIESVGEVGKYGDWRKWQVSEKGKQALRDALGEYDRHNRTGLVLTHGRANRRDWYKNR